MRTLCGKRAKHPDKTFGHQFLRPIINTYIETRLADGASVVTARLELSAIRGLFQFALDMGASDVMINPAKSVKVRKPKVDCQKAQTTSSRISGGSSTQTEVAD